MLPAHYTRSLFSRNLGVIGQKKFWHVPAGRAFLPPQRILTFDAYVGPTFRYKTQKPYKLFMEEENCFSWTTEEELPLDNLYAVHVSNVYRPRVNAVELGNQWIL